MGKPVPRSAAAPKKTHVLADTAGRPVVTPAPELIDRFDWAAVRDQDRDWLRRQTADLHRLHRRTADDFLKMGTVLLTVKERLKHGAFLPWVESALPFGRRLAQEMMAAAKAFAAPDPDPEPEPADEPEAVPAKSARRALLPSPSVMVAVSAPGVPQAAREKVLALVEAGEPVTEARAVEVIREERPDRAARPKQFTGADESEACSLLRGALIDRLDEAYSDGEVGRLLWRDSADGRLREKGLEVFQAIQAALFPEEFDQPTTGDSMVPPAGPRRVGVERLEAGVKKLLGR